MQNTEQTTSTQTVQPSSQPSRRLFSKHLLVFALAALGAGLAASLMVAVRNKASKSVWVTSPFLERPLLWLKSMIKKAQKGKNRV